MDTQSFSYRFMNLIDLLDREHNLSHDVRIGMYKELLDLITSDATLSALMLNDVLESLRLYCEELTSSNSYHIYIFFEVFREWMHTPAKTVYHDPQNVHVFMTQTTNVAKEIMNKYPCRYIGRPFSHRFFSMIETAELVNGIHMPSLFASVWLYITTHEDRDALTERLLQEMDESEDTCLSGHMVRLVNSMKGFGVAEELELHLEQYEYDKANIFNQLNRLLDVTMIDNLLGRMEVCVNSGDLDMSGIAERDVLRILGDYSKHAWTWVGDRYQCVV